MWGRNRLWKKEIRFSLKVGVIAYLLVLAFQFIGGSVFLWPLGPVVRGLLAPGLVASTVILRLLTGAPPWRFAGVLIILQSIFDIAFLSGAVLLIRSSAKADTLIQPPILPAQPVDRGGLYTIARKVKGAIKIGFAIAVLLTGVAVLAPSPALYPFEAPGPWIYARLFGQPKVGPTGFWILFGIAMSALMFAVPAFLAQLAIVAWRRRLGEGPVSLGISDRDRRK